jgi:pimeloyl-ACP methyl ester carboxylesterase
MPGLIRRGLEIVVGAALLAGCDRAGLYGSGTMLWREEIPSAALADNLLGDSADRTISVYLPAGYDAGQKRYPVLYMLQSFRGGAVDPSGVSRALETLIAAGRSKQLILVFVDGFNALGGSWYLSSTTIGDWDTFITRELVDHIDGTYRTLANRDSRAISGCSMGGYGALHLAFRHPDVFGVALGNSTSFGLWSDAGWEQGRREFTEEPADAADLSRMPLTVAAYVALAAAEAPNPSNPPLYLDMPFQIVDGSAQVVPEVKARIGAVSLEADLQRHLAQPIRLRGLMIYHGSYDGAQYARAFDRVLSQSGVSHDYLEVPAFHCGLDWSPVLRFVSDHLAL